MHPTLEILGLVITVAVVAGASRRFGWPAPLLLIVAGVIASYLPGVHRVDINPDVVLIGLLPPLLYAAAIRTSLVDFRANRQAHPAALRRPRGVHHRHGRVGHLVGRAGRVARGRRSRSEPSSRPPDAVAATTIARRVGMPRRIVSILEGESLVNDATALVALNTAIAAITGNVDRRADRLGLRRRRRRGRRWSGLLGGAGAGQGPPPHPRPGARHDPVVRRALRRVPPGRRSIHASGALAVVVTGLMLGPQVAGAAVGRVAHRRAHVNWRTVQFLLENVVFLLIGLQMRPGLLDDVHDTWRRPSGRCLAVLAATIVARLVWVFSVVSMYRFGPRRMREIAWSWQAGTVVAWAGMRGVVTLAAVFLLPEETPERAVLRAGGVLVVAGRCSSRA